MQKKHKKQVNSLISLCRKITSSTHSGLTEDEKQELGILPGLIRISAGLEHIDDIIADIEQALG